MLYKCTTLCGSDAVHLLWFFIKPKPCNVFHRSGLFLFLNMQFLDNNIGGALIPFEMIKKYGGKNSMNLSMLYFNMEVENQDYVIRDLKKKGLLIVTDYEPSTIQTILKNKNFKGLGYGNKVCNWCEIKTVTLHSHHYPIQQKDGGIETVNICPNCHQEYHSLSQKHNFIFKEEIKELLGKALFDFTNIE